MLYTSFNAVVVTMIMLVKRTQRGKKKDQPMFQYFRSCKTFNYKLNFYKLAGIFSDTSTVDHT